MLREVEEEANKLVSKNFSDSLWLMKALDELDVGLQIFTSKLH